MTKLIIPAILNSYRPRADKSFSVGLVLNEPTREQKELIDNLFQQAVYVMIKAGEIKPEEQSLMDVLEPKKGYSASQKLRFAIEDMRKRIDSDQEPEEYYQTTMSKLIEWINKK